MIPQRPGLGIVDSNASSNVLPVSPLVANPDGVVRYRYLLRSVDELTIFKTIDVNVGDACWIDWEVRDMIEDKVVELGGSWFVRDCFGAFSSVGQIAVGDRHFTVAPDGDIMTCECSSKTCVTAMMTLTLDSDWFETHTNSTKTVKVFARDHPMLRIEHRPECSSDDENMHAAKQ